MAVTRYEKNDRTLWQVYVDLRSKRDRRLRVQKRISNIKTEAEAVSLEKRLLRELSSKLVSLETTGVTWGEVIERWVRYQELYPTKKYARTTIEDYSALLRNWTKPWMKRSAAELNRGDGREILAAAETEGKSTGFRKHLKNTINLIYAWGIEERLIMGVQHSPVHGIDVGRDREEKIPEILTIQEIRNSPSSETAAAPLVPNLGGSGLYRL